MATFSASAFRAASPGLGALASAIAGDGAYGKARDSQITLQSKLAQGMAAQQAHEAQARAHDARAAQDNQETSVMKTRPDVAYELLAAHAGTTVPMVRAWRSGLVTGQPAMESATGDAGTDAAIGIPQAPTVSTAIGKLLAQLAPQYAPYRTNTKDMKPDDLAQARAIDRTSMLSDAILAGTQNPGAVGAAQAASSGKKLVDNIGNSGAGFNMFTGDGVTLDQGMKTLFADQGKALTNERNASAGASGALAKLRGTQNQGALINNGITALDFNALQEGEPMPSKVRPSVADSTNAKAVNQIVSQLRRDNPGFDGYPEERKNSMIDRAIASNQYAQGKGVKPGAKPATPAAPSGPTRINSDAEYEKLPSGAQFTGPDGVLRSKP